MQHVNRAEGCLSEFTLDEWVTGELESSECVRVEAHVASCETCRARHEALEAGRAAFLAAAPTFTAYSMRVTGAQRASRRRPLRASAYPQRALLAGSSLAVLAAAALLVVWTGSPSDQTRSKGAPHIGWFVKRGEHVHRGRAGETLYPGDALRFVYSSDAPRYLALFNLDAREASVYYPSTPSAARIDPGTDVALDFSIELDEQLGTERVHALFCEASFQVEPLRAALFDTGRLPERAGCRSELITLNKAAKR